MRLVGNRISPVSFCLGGLSDYTQKKIPAARVQQSVNFFGFAARDRRWRRLQARPFASRDKVSAPSRPAPVGDVAYAIEASRQVGAATAAATAYLLHRDPRRLISQRREPRRVVLDLRSTNNVPKLPPPEPRLQEVRLDARALPLIRR